MQSRDYFYQPSDKEGSALYLRGQVEIDVREKGILVDQFCLKNIILNLGKKEVVQALTTGTSRVLARMAIGDRGALPSDPTIPRAPEASRTSLFSEVYRQDVEVTSPTTEGATNQILFVSTFRAVDIPLSSYTDQTRPVVNEVGLVMIDLITGSPLPRTPVASPAVPNADESIFAMRTFKTVPFESANETAVTVRYTIFVGS